MVVLGGSMFRNLRLIPKDGIVITRHMKAGDISIKYMDSKDTSEETQKFFKDYYKGDNDPHLHMFDRVPIGRDLDREYRVYIFINDKPMAVYSFKEFLDSPYGYGKDDFLMIKYPVAEYRHTKIVRFISTDLFHMIFKSGIMKRVYAFAPITEGNEDRPLHRIDLSKAPCHSVVYPTDHKNIQKYISIVKQIDIPEGRIGIFEISGDIYNSIDTLDYYIKARGNAETTGDHSREALLRDLDSAVEKIKASNDN
jgi:hypothetical protein